MAAIPGNINNKILTELVKTGGLSGLALYLVWWLTSTLSVKIDQLTVAIQHLSAVVEKLK